MKSLIALKLLDTREERDFAGLSYREFTASSIGKPGGGREEVAAFLGVSIKSDTMERLGWLGLFDERPLPMAKGTNVDVIVDLMVKKMSYLPGEIDMIIVHDEIEVEFPGRRERHLSTMRVEGVPQGDSAMSRAVSLPAAIASRLILESMSRCSPNSRSTPSPFNTSALSCSCRDYVPRSVIEVSSTRRGAAAPFDGLSLA
jgi:hypothetical protein